MFSTLDSGYPKKWRITESGKTTSRKIAANPAERLIDMTLFWIPQMSGTYQDEERKKKAEQERRDREREVLDSIDEASCQPTPPEKPSGSN